MAVTITMSSFARGPVQRDGSWWITETHLTDDSAHPVVEVSYLTTDDDAGIAARMAARAAEIAADLNAPPPEDSP